MRGDKIGDDVAEAVKSFRCVFEIVGNVGLLVNELAAEVDDSYAYGVVLDVDSNECACIGVQACYCRVSASVGFKFPFLLYDAVGSQLLNEFGHSRDAQVESPG